MWKFVGVGLILFFMTVSSYSCLEQQPKPTEEQQLRMTKWEQSFSEENWAPLCWNVTWDSEMNEWAIRMSVPPSPSPDDPELGKEANPDWPWMPGQKPPYPESTYPGTPEPAVTGMSWDTELGEWQTRLEAEDVQ